MKKPMVLGDFRELPYGSSSGPVLAEAIAAGPLADASMIAQYLRTCYVIAATSQHAVDVVDPEQPDIGPMDAHTDGTWIWHEDLAFYVERYGVSLPESFVSHVRAKDYRPPTFSQEETNELIAALLPG